jgi:hypothetical protein
MRRARTSFDKTAPDFIVAPRGAKGGVDVTSGMISPRAWRRRLWFGLLTVTGIRKRGYFAPSLHAGAADPALCLSPELEARFAAEADAMRARLSALDAHADAFAAIGRDPAPAPRWTQGWFPRLDAAMAYAMTRAHRPRRIVEVGAGHSTRFFCRAVTDGGLETEILAIDPKPRAASADLPFLRLVAQPVQRAGADIADSLAAGDILSIDSGHVLMPGSDVDLLVNAVLPALPPGVLVHFHDIFLPDPYPAEWDWRGYNEQSTIAPLIHQGGWRVVFGSRYAATRLADAVAQSAVANLPRLPNAFESSLWLVRA